MHISRDDYASIIPSLSFGGVVEPLKIAIWRKGFRSISQIRTASMPNRDIGAIIPIVLDTS